MPPRSGAYAERTTFDRAGLWPERRPRLGRFDIELTERCNNDCIHCLINLPADDPAARQREMPTAQVNDAVAQAAALGAMSVRFTGGEPLLRADFQDLYLFARRQGLGVVLFTNARLITPELARLLARFPAQDKVEVSVYGMKESSYEAVTRVKGSYAEARRGIDLLLKHRIPFVVKNAWLPANRAERSEFECWAAAVPGMDRPPSYALLFDLRARRDSPARNRQIATLRPQPGDCLAFLTRDRVAYFREMRQFCSRFMGVQGDRLFTCGAGNRACVDAQGQVQACLPLRHPDTTYDLKNGSLRDALADFFPRLRELKATNPDYLARCARCFLRGLCEQCPAKSWTEHGTLDTPVDYLCRVAHVQGVYLGLLREGEPAWEVSDWRNRVRELAAGRERD